MEKESQSKSRSQDTNNSIDEEEEDQYQIFVGGCSPDTTESQLKTYFQKFGQVKEIRLMKDKTTGKNFFQNFFGKKFFKKFLWKKIF